MCLLEPHDSQVLVPSSLWDIPSTHSSSLAVALCRIDEGCIYREAFFWDTILLLSIFLWYVVVA